MKKKKREYEIEGVTLYGVCDTKKIFPFIQNRTIFVLENYKKE